MNKVENFFKQLSPVEQVPTQIVFGRGGWQYRSRAVQRLPPTHQQVGAHEDLPRDAERNHPVSHRSDRNQVLAALAEFDRACARFSRGMAEVLQPPEADAALRHIVEELGAPRPARRAQAKDARELSRARRSG